MSRWSRSTEDLLKTMGDFAEWNVSVVAPNGDLQFDFSTSNGKLMITVLAAFEFERSLIKERVKSGVKAAKARGVMFVRPELNSNKAKRIKELLDSGESVRAVAATMRCSPTTVQKQKKSKAAS